MKSKLARKSDDEIKILVYDGVNNNQKLSNFIDTLWNMEVSKLQFANEIERYFFYYSIRKTNVAKALDD